MSFLILMSLECLFTNLFSFSHPFLDAFPWKYGVNHWWQMQALKNSTVSQFSPEFCPETFSNVSHNHFVQFYCICINKVKSCKIPEQTTGCTTAHQPLQNCRTAESQQPRTARPAHQPTFLIPVHRAEFCSAGGRAEQCGLNNIMYHHPGSLMGKSFRQMPLNIIVIHSYARQ